MVDWKDISTEFSIELQQQWENKGFKYEEVKKWIYLGFKPNDYELVSFIKNELHCNVEEVPDHNSNITTFREIYRKSLENKKQEEFEDLQLQEAINQSLLNLGTNEDDELQKAFFLSLGQESKIDMGWLTDDNITYILENDEIIKKAIDRDVQIKTDIANIYFQMEEAKQSRKIADEFWDTLDVTKKHVILPLRVSGNHWSLLIIVQNEVSGKPWYLNYISSLSYQTAQQEVEEIEPFLKQLQEKFGGKDVFLFDKNDKFKIINKDNLQQSNSWDCGVYLCKFIEFLSQNELYSLDEENPLITPQKVKEFRDKWKKQIGEEKWCRWDNSERKMSSEDEQLKAALALSLTTVKEDDKLQQNVADEATKETTKIIDDLSKQVIFLEKENEELRKELAAERKQNLTLIQELKELKIKSQQKELEELKEKLKTKLNESDHEELDGLLEAQEEFTKNNNSYAEKQLKRIKDKLKTKEVKNEELEKICELQKELVKLRIEELKQEEAQVEIVV